MSDQGMPLLELRALSKNYAGQGFFSRSTYRVLWNIDLQVFPGEIVALVGESGSGKSTILKVIARLVPPSSGHLLWRGQDLLALEPRAASLSFRGEVQMVFQDPFASLNPFHTIGYALRRPLLRHGIADSKASADAEAASLLEDVGLAPGREFLQKHPSQLSGGQRQRVAIARALTVRPSLILADEPVSMLDVSIRIGILNLLDDLRQTRRISYLFVTHDLASARYLADRIVVLYAGQVVEEGPADLVLETPLHPYTRLLRSSVPEPRREHEHPLSEAAPAQRAPRIDERSDKSPLCPFRSRCPEAIARCAKEPPRLVQIASKNSDKPRQARCHLVASES